MASHYNNIFVISDFASIARFFAKFAVIGFGAAFGFLINTFVQRAFLRHWERSAFINECRDLLRHFRENIDAIDKILSQSREIRINHVKHLKLHPKASEFSPELYRSLHPSEVSRIYHLKVTLRNLEIDIEEAINIHKNESAYNLREYLEFLRFRIDRAEEKVYCNLRRIEPSRKPRRFAFR